MTSMQISNLTATEKLQLMEALWDDLRQKADDCEIPREHLEILDARWARVKSGESTLLDWDKVKHSIGRL